MYSKIVAFFYTVLILVIGISLGITEGKRSTDLDIRNKICIYKGYDSVERKKSKDYCIKTNETDKGSVIIYDEQHFPF